MKKIVSLLIVIAMLVSMVPAVVVGAEEVSGAPQMKDGWTVAIAPMFVVDEVTAAPGSTVDVTIAVKNNPGITSIKLSVEYSDVLTLTSATGNPDLGRNFLRSPEGKYPVVLNWYDGLYDIDGDWVFATLTFTVAEDADFGEYPITITYDPNDVFNFAETNVEFAIDNGSVTVVCPHTNKQYVEKVEIGCETEGYMEHYICPDCGAILEADGVTETTMDNLRREPMGHSGEEFVEIELAPGCETEGSKKITVTCQNCSKVLSEESLPIDPIGHDYKATVTAPTCTEQGYTTYTCANCGNSYKADYVDATGHSYGEWYQTKAPGCETTGTERHDCACGHYETREVKATGHDYKATVTAPTCTEQGYTTYTCANCGDSYKADYVDATGHTWDEGVITVEPTEETEGERKHTCIVCGETKVVSIPTLDHVHDYEAVVTAPTCTEQGYTTYTCRCGDSYKADYVDATGHDYKATVTAPTCTEQGYTTYTCANCGNSYKADYVDATGHSWEGTYYAPTCGKDGYTVYTCACGESYMEEEVGSALEHSYDEDGICVHCGHEEGALKFQLGDVNMDGKIDTIDAYLIVQDYNEIIHLTDEQRKLADVDGNHEVDTTDAYWIVQRYNELIEKFPAEE